MSANSRTKALVSAMSCFSISFLSNWSSSYSWWMLLLLPTVWMHGSGSNREGGGLLSWLHGNNSP